MKTCSLATALRSSLIALIVLPAAFAATDTPAPEQAARLLATHGAVSISSVGRYVQPGSYRVQVATKLGQPDVRLPDGSWLYHHRKIDGAQATGTLVVQFDGHRVSALSLVTPKVAAAMATPQAKPAPELLATTK